MNEFITSGDLSPAQEALHDACDLILEAHAAETAASGRIEATIYSQADAAEVRASLCASSLSDLLLKEGASLSIDNPDGRAGRKQSADAEERLRARWLGDTDAIQEEMAEDAASGNANRFGMPDLDLFVGTVVLSGVGLAIRQDLSPQSGHWQDRLGIFFRYKNDRHQAFEVLSARTDSNWSNGTLRAKLGGHVTSPSYGWGMHYDGHLPAYRILGQAKQDTPRELFDFIELAHDLAAQAVQES